MTDRKRGAFPGMGLSKRAPRVSYDDLQDVAAVDDGVEDAELQQIVGELQSGATSRAWLARRPQ